MIKFITKHRRGTQLQWSRSEVIPEKGEIIIIDPVLEGDVPRLKVGDGEHKYKDLPYIDENIKQFFNLSDNIITLDGGDITTYTQ